MAPLAPNFARAPRPPLRVGVLISGSGSTLLNLAERVADGRLPGVEIPIVISSRTGAPGVARAKSAGLNVEVVARRSFANCDAFSEAVYALLDAQRVDLVALGGFLSRLRVPARFANRIINVHPSLLPRFGGVGMYGRNVHEAVLAARDEQTGCTVHIVDEEYDHGPIIAQATTPVLPGDTPDALAGRVQAAERELYPRVIAAVARHGVAWLSHIADGRARWEDASATD